MPREQKLYTIPDLSEELSIPDNTLRKYVNYFELEVERRSRKVYLTDKSVRTIKSIVKLRNNRLPLSQIKSLLSILSRKERLTNQERQSQTQIKLDQVVEEPKEQEPEEIKEEEKLEDSVPTSEAPAEIEEKPKEVSQEAPLPQISESSSFRPKSLEELEEAPVKEEKRENKEEKEKKILTKNALNSLVANASRKIARIKKKSYFLEEGKELEENKIYVAHLQMFLNGARNLRDNWVEEDKKRVLA